jgi:hypothetical protein
MFVFRSKEYADSKSIPYVLFYFAFVHYFQLQLVFCEYNPKIVSVCLIETCSKLVYNTKVFYLTFYLNIVSHKGMIIIKLIVTRSVSFNI